MEKKKKNKNKKKSKIRKKKKKSLVFAAGVNFILNLEIHGI